MEVILLQDVDKLGTRGQVVKVAGSNPRRAPMHVRQWSRPGASDAAFPNRKLCNR